MKKKSCSNCFWFIYFPPFVQKVLNEPQAFHCAKDKWRDKDDPQEFLKPMKCKKWKINKPNQHEGLIERIQNKRLQAVGPVLKRTVVHKLKRNKKPISVLIRTKNKGKLRRTK